MDLWDALLFRYAIGGFIIIIIICACNAIHKRLLRD